MRGVVLATLLILAISSRESFAEPITVGTWSLAPIADNDQIGFYDGLSWDCAECNVGFHLKGQLEYLHNGLHRPIGFGYRHFQGAELISRMTDWVNGSFSWDAASGSFMYSTGTGFFYNSWQGTNMVLFRLVASAATTYWLGIEDIPVGWGREDRDFNDSIYRWTVVTSLPPPPSPIPEPGTLRLALAGLVTVVGWRMRCRRNSS